MTDAAWWWEADPVALVAAQAELLVSRDGWDPWAALKQAHRVWSRIDRSGPCWLWTGASVKGRGAINWFGKVSTVPWVVCTLVHGDGGVQWALHSCDLALCAHPDHLRWGTPQENSDDRWERGPGKRLSRHDAAAIRLAHEAGAVRTELAAEYGVPYQTIDDVVQYRTWRNA